MVYHWAEAHPFVFHCRYPGHGLDFERMSCSRGYVSVFRIQGVPILPPILTEEEREQCRMYRQQAMDVERRLHEKKLLKERQLQLEQSKYEDENCSSAEMEVLEFIRKALGDSNDLEEVKLLISQVGEELQKRRSIGSRNSTLNDVDNFSLNQSTDPCNLDVVSNYFDKQSLDESDTYDNHSGFQLESTKFDLDHLVTEASISVHSTPLEKNKVISEPEETLEFSRNAHQLPYDEVPDSYVPETSKFDLSEPHNETVSPVRSCKSETFTPPKLIRSNSYTLDSPSPSVLMYLRSLALESSNGKFEASSKVVKNLSNFWEEEEENKENTPLQIISKENFPLQVVSELENGVENIESDNSDEELNGYGTPVNNKVSFIEVPDGIDEVEVDEEKVKAATIIQAAARSFLVRRLMKTQKIKDLKVIIKEAVLCAWNLYGEQAVSPADVQLHERIIQQVTAACYELHSIFFNWSTTDRMALIRSDREKLKNPKPKFRPSRDRKISESNSVSSSIRSKSASSVSAMSRSSTPRELRPTTLPTALRKNISHQAWSR